MVADRQQRDQALDPTRSFIVEAPAGSGKTGLLLQRFLRLLSGVERPESVVAMTFTRKAADEIKTRVLDALAAAGDPTEEIADEFVRKTRDLATAVLFQDRAKGWKLSEDSSRLQIQTIDSFCALLTRQMPVLSDFGGITEVIDEASELYLRAAREMLTNLAEGDEPARQLFRRMVLHFDNNISRLETQVVRMLGKRDQWEHLHAAADAQLVQDCCAMLKRAESHLRLVFQRAGKVDFTEISRAARRALGKPEQPSDLLYSLDYRLQHLLVDEFQDTSRSQYELVKALTEQWSLDDDHTLFIVGDPMQSIYRFREADVSLFLKCWKDESIGAVKLTRLQLETNFRTTPQILNWVDTHFAPMMPDDDPEKGAVQFRRSSSGREALGGPPQLIAHIADKGSEEAAEIVRIIQQSEGRSVAVLVRSRSQTAHILPALRRAGIVYEAIDIDVLRDQPHIIDLLSLTRAITNVADRVAWLACLRAPWCGLTLADLSALAEGRREQNILDLLSGKEGIARLPIAGRWRAVRAQEILSVAVSRVGRMPLRHLVEDTWRTLGGAAAISEHNQLEDVATLFRLMEESDEGGMIRDFSLLNKKLEFLYARPAVSGSKVVVMTVYQAKGLEFDVVILPQLAKKVRSDEAELLVWAERKDAEGLTELAIAAMPQTGVKNPEYDEIRNIAKEKDDNESRRLFYVACTRAKNELHIIGSVNTRKGGDCSTPPSGTFLRHIWEAVQPHFLSQARSRIQPQPGNDGGNGSRSVLRRLPERWRQPVIAESVQAITPIRRAVASRNEISYHWVKDTARHTGTLVHEILWRVAAEGVDKWTEGRVLSMSVLVQSELRRLGVPQQDLKDATNKVLRAVINTVTGVRGRWILSAHAEARSEWAVTGFVNSLLVNGTVDRAFRDGDGVYWIVDFKNSPHGGGSLAEFLANEKLRYQPQLELYASVIGRMVNGPIRLGLYFPLLDEWLEWQFAEAAAASN